jgi:hypothetical protein
MKASRRLGPGGTRGSVKRQRGGVAGAPCHFRIKMRRGARAAGTVCRAGWALAAGWLFAVGVAGAEPPAKLDPSKLPPPAQVEIVFSRDIKPILTNTCYRCHSGEKPKSHFLLTSREPALKGGNEGVDILPGQSAKSPLIYYVARLVPEMEMPPEDKGTPLTREQVGLFRAWIDQGVKWEETEPEKKMDIALSPTVGWTSVSGDKSKFRELNWQREGWNGGGEFHMIEKPTPDSKVTADGHMLLNDYKLTLSAEKNDVGFTRFGWSQFRKYFDDSGGYYPSFSPSIFDLNRDLYLDTGRAWADFGLTLPDWPRMVLGYEYQYRDGTESTTQWGPVSNGSQTRNIYPAYKDISEHVHVLKFDLDYEVDDARITDSFRGEWYSLATGQHNDAFDRLGATEMAMTVANQTQTYFQGANTVHLEKQFTDWLFASGGYLYSSLNGDASVNVSTINTALLAPASFAPGWNAKDIELERDSHVLSLSTLLGPWQGLSLSLGSQNEWTHQTGFGNANANVALSFLPPPGTVPLGIEHFQASTERSVYTQEAGLRFTKIPFTTLFAEGRLQQETTGQTEQETGGLTPFLLQTDTQSRLEDFRGGFYSSPWRRVSLSGQYHQYDHHSDYDNSRKETIPPDAPYPGFILWRDLLSQEAEAKLSLQATPWLKTTLSYQWIQNKYHTSTDPTPELDGGISPGGSLLAGRYEAQTVAFNATLTPWRRLFLSTTFSFQTARTVTAANDSPSVQPYDGNIYSVIASGTYVLNQKTDLTASYSFSTADFSQNNFADGLPLGINYQQQALQVGIRRQIGKGKTLGLHYSYYHYDEPSSGGFNNFNAHAVFATLSFQLP